VGNLEKEADLYWNSVCNGNVKKLNYNGKFIPVPNKLRAKP
jgi:hypothetical protein